MVKSRDCQRLVLLRFCILLYLSNLLELIFSYLLLFESILFLATLVRCYVLRTDGFSEFQFNKCIFRGLSSMICHIGTSLRAWGRATRTSTTALVGSTRRVPPSICQRTTSQCFLIRLSDILQTDMTYASFTDNDYCLIDTRAIFMKTLSNPKSLLH